MRAVRRHFPNRVQACGLVGYGKSDDSTIPRPPEARRESRSGQQLSRTSPIRIGEKDICATAIDETLSIRRPFRILAGDISQAPGRAAHDRKNPHWMLDRRFGRTPNQQLGMIGGDVAKKEAAERSRDFRRLLVEYGRLVKPLGLAAWWVGSKEDSGSIRHNVRQDIDAARIGQFCIAQNPRRRQGRAKP